MIMDFFIFVLLLIHKSYDYCLWKIGEIEATIIYKKTDEVMLHCFCFFFTACFQDGARRVQ